MWRAQDGPAPGREALDVALVGVYGRDGDEARGGEGIGGSRWRCRGGGREEGVEARAEVVAGELGGFAAAVEGLHERVRVSEDAQRSSGMGATEPRIGRRRRRTGTNLEGARGRVLSASRLALLSLLPGLEDEVVVRVCSPGTTEVDGRAAGRVAREEAVHGLG